MKRGARASLVLLPLVLPVALLGAGCSPAPTPVPSRNLDRPTDIVFGCIGLFGHGTPQEQVSGRPISVCNPPLEYDPLPIDFTHRSFGFVPNTGRGELSVIDMDASNLLDLDSATPGITSVPIGELPEQISASDDGCRLVTANRGSCDLTLVDPSVLVSRKLHSEAAGVTVPETGPEKATETIAVTRGDGTRLSLAPQELLFLPQDTSADIGTNNLCPASLDDPATPTPWRALITFPSCDLVALIDLPSGQIIDSVTVALTSGGVTLTPSGPNPTCAAADCGAGTRPSLNDPATNLPRPRPSSLAMMPDGSRAYIGLAGAEAVAAVNVTAAGLTPGGVIKLHEGPQGVDRVRLSVDPYQKGLEPGQDGRFVGEGPDRLRQYLYAFTRDGTVRVVDVSPSARLEPEVECDTNIDPSQIPADQRTNPCFPVVDGPNPLRRASAQGPGIRLPSIPVDVAFADLKLGDARQQVLDGSYGFILTASGMVYIVNIDPTLRTLAAAAPTVAPTAANPPEDQPLVSSLRDRNQLTFQTSLDPAAGPPRLDVAPPAPSMGPQLQAIPVTDARDNVTLLAAASPLTFVFFPERTDVRPQQWLINWEGDLFGTGFAGQVKNAPAASPSSEANLLPYSGPATFVDVGVNFCQVGTLKGDIVNIFGCTVDSDCGPLRVCRHSDTAPPTVGNLSINGLCVDAEGTLQTKELTSCERLLGTVKRYEVLDAKTNALTVRPKLDEVPDTQVAGCQTDLDCRKDPSWMSFSCLAVEGTKRCVQSCNDSQASTVSACRTGRVCVTFPDGFVEGTNPHLCADAPPLTSELVASCLPQLFAYKVQAGNSFIVQGSATAPAIPFASAPDGTCLADVPDRNPLLVNRISLRPQPPACNLPAPKDGESALLAIVHSTPSPNPCLFDLNAVTGGTSTSSGTDAGSGSDGGTAPDGGDGGSQVAASGLNAVAFRNTEIQFILSHLDEGTPDIEPIRFDVHGGFAPDSVLVPTTIDIGMPTRIVVSPFDSQTQVSAPAPPGFKELPFLFVVDQRRLGRAAAGVGATRGQILRINPRKANSDSSSLLPVYDEPDTTGNHWPIQ